MFLGERGNDGVAGCRSALALTALVCLQACSAEDVTRLFDPRAGDPGQRPDAFLNFPPEARQAPAMDRGLAGFPRLLSETGAFSDTARLEAAEGLVSYDLRSPLWSDGAFKRRWLSLPELGSIRVSDEGSWQVPEGTVLVKHFELALDERQPDVRQRLETRLLIAAAAGSFYGVTYRWSPDQTDAELVLEAETLQLPVIDAQGVSRSQPYYVPGPRDCLTCHTAAAGHVLGLRTRQLNRARASDPSGYPTLEEPASNEAASSEAPINELEAWSAWGFLDRGFDAAAVADAPHLVDIDDETAGLEARVRSYWDSNCAMCHAGGEGSVVGWDARYFTPLDQTGIAAAPQMAAPGVPAALIAPGDPEGSYIYLRSATAERGLRMPPIGRNRVDARYVDVLARWIESL